MAEPRTLFDKIWQSHVIAPQGEGTYLIYIDLHLIHEVTTPQAFEGLRAAGRKVRRPDATIAVCDHNIRPEQGLSQPGMTIVCGDSHTATHGAMGALAFGIGTSEVEHVLATQTLIQAHAKNMLVEVNGSLGAGVSPKDVILAIIGKIGTAGGTGHVIEYGGSTFRSMSMEGRMTVCNMAIESGARAGLVAPDETTFEYVKGRAYAPKGGAWEQALAYWKTLPSDPGAHFDKKVSVDASGIAPHVTWGTNPEQTLPITGRVPDPAEVEDPLKRAAIERALQYMQLKPNTPLVEVPVQR